MSDIHVLQLIDGLKIGGAEMLLSALTEGLVNRGFRVSVGYSTPGPLAHEMKSRGIQVTRIPRVMRVDPLLFAGMVRLIRRDAPQIVHTHLFKSDFHGRLAARLAGVPVVVSTLHSIDRWLLKRPLGAMYGWTTRYADRMIAVSDDVRNFYLKHTGALAEKLVTIENGVDINRYIGQKVSGEKIRKEFELGDTSILFGIIGRLTPPKNHALFLHAASMILNKVPHARFLIVGDGPLRHELESLANALGLTHALIFTGFRSDIPEILSALDILVFSSQWEGLPVALLEGMAAARPVVATAVGGIPDVVLPDKTAFLVPPSDVASLAEACLKLASDPELRNSFGKAGFERVTLHYSIERMLDRTASLYIELLRARGLAHLIPLKMQDKAIV